MGIHKLFQLLESKAEKSFREVSIEIFTAQKLAIDASKVRSADNLSIHGFNDELLQ